MQVAPYESLIQLAAEKLNPHRVDDRLFGDVASVLVSRRGDTYAGVCIDTGSGTGFCAEHSAIAAMVTAGEYRIERIVAVWRSPEGLLHVLPPCGRCREFIRQVEPANLDTEVVLGLHRSARLRELLPEHAWPEPLDDGGVTSGAAVTGPVQVSGALSRSVHSTGRDAHEFADSLMAFLAASRRTRGRLQPLFDDITVPQLVLLDAIEQCGKNGVGAVADVAGLTQPTVTRSVNGLVRLDLVRHAADPHDQRRRVLVLTDHGQRLLAAKRAVVAGHLAGAWDGLSPEERELASPLLRHLAELVERLF